MPITYESPHNCRVGDLVHLSYDEFRMYGYGIVLWEHKNGEYEVYWFRDSRIDLETCWDIRPVRLTEDDGQVIIVT